MFSADYLFYYNFYIIAPQPSGSGKVPSEFPTVPREGNIPFPWCGDGEIVRFVFCRCGNPIHCIKSELYLAK